MKFFVGQEIPHISEGIIFKENKSKYSSSRSSSEANVNMIHYFQVTFYKGVVVPNFQVTF